MQKTHAVKVHFSVPLNTPIQDDLAELLLLEDSGSKAKMLDQDYLHSSASHWLPMSTNVRGHPHLKSQI